VKKANAERPPSVPPVREATEITNAMAVLRTNISQFKSMFYHIIDKLSDIRDNSAEGGWRLDYLVQQLVIAVHSMGREWPEVYMTMM